MEQSFQVLQVRAQRKREKSSIHIHKGQDNRTNIPERDVDGSDHISEAATPTRFFHRTEGNRPVRRETPHHSITSLAVLLVRICPVRSAR